MVDQHGVNDAIVNLLPHCVTAVCTAERYVFDAAHIVLKNTPILRYSECPNDVHIKPTLLLAPSSSFFFSIIATLRVQSARWRWLSSPVPPCCCRVWYTAPSAKALSTSTKQAYTHCHCSHKGVIHCHTNVLCYFKTKTKWPLNKTKNKKILSAYLSLNKRSF